MLPFKYKVVLTFDTASEILGTGRNGVRTGRKEGRNWGNRALEVGVKGMGTGGKEDRNWEKKEG